MSNRQLPRKLLLTAIGLAPVAALLTVASTASAHYSDARLKKAIRLV